jgi:hypothetical protein
LPQNADIPGHHLFRNSALISRAIVFAGIPATAGSAARLRAVRDGRSRSFRRNSPIAAVNESKVRSVTAPVPAIVVTPDNAALG